MLSQIPILGNIFINISFERSKINKIVNRVLLAGYKLISEMDSRQHGFTYNACGPITKSKERIQENSEKQKIEDTFIKTN